MQISCPKCKKKFEVNEDLIPVEGRDVQCGSCDNIWFFTKISTPKTKEAVFKKKIPKLKKTHVKIQTKSIDEKPVINDNYVKNNKVKPKEESNFKKNNINYFKTLIVIIISIIALIILLDTFKNQISIFYPNIKLILENLYESFRDINLFLKDLIN